MKIRILRPEEWSELNVPDLPMLLPYVAPQNIVIVVAENDAGEIIGCISALRVTHLEGIWVKPEYRGGIVAMSLLEQALAIAKVHDESWVLGGARDSDATMDDYIRRLGGTPLPMKFYPMPVGGH